MQHSREYTQKMENSYSLKQSKKEAPKESREELEEMVKNYTGKIKNFALNGAPLN